MRDKGRFCSSRRDTASSEACRLLGVNVPIFATRLEGGGRQSWNAYTKYARNKHKGNLERNRKR